MITLSEMLAGGVLPAVVAAVTLWITWRLSGNQSLAWTLGVFLGYLSGHWALDVLNVGLADALKKTISPLEARDWLPLLVLLFAVPEVVALRGKLGALTAWALCAAAGAFTTWRLMSLHRDYPTSELVKAGFNESPWTWSLVGWTIVAVAVGLLIAWRITTSSRGAPASVWRSVLVTIIAVCAAAFLALTGSLTTGQLFGIMAGTIGGCGVAAWVAGVKSGPEAAPGPLLGLFLTLLMMALLYIEGGPSAGRLALVASSLVLALVWLPASKKWQIGVRTVICLAPVVIALVLAAQDFSAPETTDEVPDSDNPHLNWQPPEN